MPGVLALSAFLLAAPAQAAPAPAPGVFLVAKSSIDGGPFWHSVVLLVRHGNDGTLGLIVNRTTEIPLAEALPDLSTEEAEDHDLYFGGPVALDGLLYLFRSAEPRKTASQVMDDVHFSGDKELLDRLLDEKVKRNELHLYLGHAGWAAGQLVNELARGDWDVVRADAFTIFQADPEKLWDELTSENTAVIASAHSSLTELDLTSDDSWIMHFTNRHSHARLSPMVGKPHGFSHLDRLSTISSTFFITLFPNIFSINSWSSSSSIFGGRLRGVGFRFFFS